MFLRMGQTHMKSISQTTKLTKRAHSEPAEETSGRPKLLFVDI